MADHAGPLKPSHDPAAQTDGSRGYGVMLAGREGRHGASQAVLSLE
jgi:hypothetical protein